MIYQKSFLAALEAYFLYIYELWVAGSLLWPGSARRNEEGRENGDERSVWCSVVKREEVGTVTQSRTFLC
jgi:hypothetical protein